MDQDTLSSELVLETLLKTNRPPTDQEKTIIQQSMAPTNAKLKVVGTQITDTMAYIEALKAQIKHAEIRLQHLHEEEAAILETFADHRRIFSPFRNLPEDILREIFVSCVEGDIPTLAYGQNPMPYVLAQISSGMRHIALTTPFIWASMNVSIGRLFYFDSPGDYEQPYSILARRASEWFERAGRLPLTVFIQDPSSARSIGSDSDPPSILMDTILSYSTRWKEIRFKSHCNVVPPPMIRIAAFTAVDAPLLQSVSLSLNCPMPNSMLRDSVLLTLPTLKNVTLDTDSVRRFTVKWAILVSITLRGGTNSFLYQCEMAKILHQTKCLVSCDIIISLDRLEQHYPNNINLPFLKTLIVQEIINSETASSGVPSILDLITAPILEKFDINGVREFFDLSALPDFFKRSPRISRLSLPYSNKDDSLTETMEFLSYCPSLAELSLWPCKWSTYMATCDVNRFLRAFVEEGDTGIICPRLQHFKFWGHIDFSVETLRLFLEGKQEYINMPNVLPWKKVKVYIGGTNSTKTCQQMLDLVSQKKAAGLDVTIATVQYRG